MGWSPRIWLAGYRCAIAGCLAGVAILIAGLGARHLDSHLLSQRAVAHALRAVQHEARDLDVVRELQSAATALRLQTTYTRREFSAIEKPTLRQRLTARWQAHRLRQDLRALREGRDPLVSRRGLLLRGHHSEIDGSDQPYWLYVPPRYSSRRLWPLIIHLHAHGWFRPFQGRSIPRPSSALVLSPHGRGSTDFMALGEQDVLAALADVRDAYNIDPDRIYLMGSSMGGTGCWQLAAHHPHLFAAIAPASGNTDHHVWEEEWLWGEMPDSKQEPVLRRLEDLLDPITYAGNLQHIPAYVVHGTRDEVVPVEHARRMVDRLRRNGGRVIYRQFRLLGHGGFPPWLRRDRIRWLLRHHRQPLARQFTVRTATLQQSDSPWARVTGIHDPTHTAALHIRRRRGRWSIQTENVDSFALRPPPADIGRAGSLTITVDGQTVQHGALHAGAVISFHGSRDSRWEVGSPPSPHKNELVSGPIDHVFHTPFLIVSTSDSRDARTRALIHGESRRLAKEWRQRYAVSAPLVHESDLSDADRNRYSLVITGLPQASALVHEVVDDLPFLRMDGDRVRLGEREFRGADVGIQVCYPSPFNPDRYVALFTGTSWRAIYQSRYRFGNWFDWGCYDNHAWFDYAVFDDRSVGPETLLLWGFFDNRWRLTDRLCWQGDPALRERTRPRDLPPLHARPRGAGAWLSDSLPLSVEQLKGPVELNRSFRGGLLRVAGLPVEKGFGVRSPSRIVYRLDRPWSALTAEVGLDDEGCGVHPARAEVESTRFRVLGDGCPLADSGPLTWDNPRAELHCNLDGVRLLELVTEPVDWHRWLHGSAAWGNVRLWRHGPWQGGPMLAFAPAAPHR